ncbi:hypothetical protein HHL22_08310 [Hymenobacter sp. RP-2-7]|uniref:DUF4133 domain-containing protein n=1 Tax=Hymenobacter polaris TaxID=2682546 RepID=A0A7Y0FLV9_9BACT|nr:hypothetical protein [Hymenobacter polaris]NML65203.1 hypothetical protein [Hymenobacter polaris]
MLRRYLLALLLLACWPAHAQGSLPIARPAVADTARLRPAAAAPDTAAALHRYFAQRRHNGRVTLGVGGGILVVGYTMAAVSNKGGSLPVFLVGALGVVASVPILVQGALRIAAHSQGRERRVLRTWQQHRLPRRWARRALVPDYTQPPTPR